MLLVSAADKLDHARAINADLRVHGQKLWERFSGGDQSLWYYDALANAYATAALRDIVPVLQAAVTEMHQLSSRSR